MMEYTRDRLSGVHVITVRILCLMAFRQNVSGNAIWLGGVHLNSLREIPEWLDFRIDLSKIGHGCNYMGWMFGCTAGRTVLYQWTRLSRGSLHLVVVGTNRG